MKTSTRIKALLITAVLLISTLVYTSCLYTGYKGDEPELYSVSWANLPTADGCWADGCELINDSVVYALDKDSEGRVLFCYFEGYGSYMNLLIMQYYDEEYAYYYPEDCYVSFTVSNEDFVGWRCICPTENEVQEIIETDISEEKLLALKAANDWGQPIDKSKCDSTEIVRNKPDGKIKLKDSDFEKIAEEYYKNSGKYIHPKNVSFVGNTSFIMSDDYGRELYLAYSRYTEYTSKSEITYNYPLLIVIYPDKSCDVSTIILLEDTENPQEYIKEIKANNAWNTPLS